MDRAFHLRSDLGALEVMMAEVRVRGGSIEHIDDEQPCPKPRASPTSVPPSLNGPPVGFNDKGDDDEQEAGDDRPNGSQSPPGLRLSDSSQPAFFSPRTPKTGSRSA